MTGQCAWMPQWPATLSSMALPGPCSWPGSKRVRFMGSGSRGSIILGSPDSRSSRATTLSTELSSGQAPGLQEGRASSCPNQDTVGHTLGCRRLRPPADAASHTLDEGCPVCSCTQAQAKAKPSPPWGVTTLLGLILSESSANPGSYTQDHMFRGLERDGTALGSLQTFTENRTTRTKLVNSISNRTR